jgi:NAD(P)-dependent dehydrogenase (short-subunit alcohol dehydrogenase family)
MPFTGLSSRVFIVTGAAGGIGRAVAHRLLAEGAEVALVDLRQEDVEAVAAEMPGHALSLSADVSAEGDVERYVAATVERFGRVDGLHNNAGISGTQAAVRDFSVEDYRRVFDVNVLGVLLGMKHVIRQLRTQGDGGSIVNTASAGGIIGAQTWGVYGASKAAVINATKAAALEEARFGIRVNAISPGYIHTPMVEAGERVVAEDQQQARALIHSMLPIARYGEPAEVAALVAFLLSQESRYQVGAVFNIDAGVTVGQFFPPADAPAEAAVT